MTSSDVPNQRRKVCLQCYAVGRIEVRKEAFVLSVTPSVYPAPCEFEVTEDRERFRIITHS